MLHISEDVLAKVRAANATHVAQGSMRSAPLGERMAREALQGRYVYVLGIKRWYRWNGRRWIGEDRFGESAHRLVHEWVVSEIRDLAAGKAGSAEINKMAAYRDVGGLRALMEGAKTYPGIVIEPDQLDRDPWLLNVQNGSVDLRTGELKAHDPLDYCTRIAGAEFHPDAEHPDLTQALTALPGEAEREWFQRRIGQASTGHPPEDDRVVIAHGDGSNAKSAILDAAKVALGDYAGVIMDSALLKVQSHPTELFDLKGLRLALLEELPEDKFLDVQAMKKIVGTGSIKARPIGGDPIEFRASHSLFITTNYEPRISETDHGTWRRLVMAPFPFRFVEDPDPGQKHQRKADLGLKPRLVRGRQQREAVLAWIIDGARKVFEEGFAPDPASVVAATAEWRGGADLLEQYWDEHLILDSEAAAPTALLAWHFGRYVKDRGHAAPSEKTFLGKLKSHRRYVGACGVEIRKQRSTKTITHSKPPPGAFGEFPPNIGTTPMCVVGVRWRTAADDVEEDS